VKDITEKNYFDVEYGTNYRVTARADGFIDGSTTLSIETNELISVNFMLKNMQTKKNLYRGKLNKDTVLTLGFKSKYRIYALSRDYLFDKEVLDFSKVDQYQFTEFPIKLQKVKPGAKLTLDEIFFESNAATLDDSSMDELSEVYRFLNYNKRIVVEIAAHTDNVGTHADNMTLSNARAQTVVNFLISKGVDESRIQAKGYGESQPIESNNAKKGRSKNRRVEFRVLKVN